MNGSDAILRQRSADARRAALTRPSGRAALGGGLALGPAKIISVDASEPPLYTVRKLSGCSSASSPGGVETGIVVSGVGQHADAATLSAGDIAILLERRPEQPILLSGSGEAAPPDVMTEEWHDFDLPSHAETNEYLYSTPNGVGEKYVRGPWFDGFFVHDEHAQSFLYAYPNSSGGSGGNIWHYVLPVRLRPGSIITSARLHGRWFGPVAIVATLCYYDYTPTSGAGGLGHRWNSEVDDVTGTAIAQWFVTPLPADIPGDRLAYPRTPSVFTNPNPVTVSANRAYFVELMVSAGSAPTGGSVNLMTFGLQTSKRVL